MMSLRRSAQSPKEGSRNSGRALVCRHGHQWAGNDPKVAGLVYISALVPTKANLRPTRPRDIRRSRRCANQTRCGGLAELTRRGVDEDLSPNSRRAKSGRLCDARAVEFGCAERQGLQPRVERPERSWFIAVNDRSSRHPSTNSTSRGHIHATTTVLTSGHVAMLATCSGRVAAVIVDAANKAGR